MDDNNYSLPFSEYLKTLNGKYAIAITKRQYAIIVGGLIHEGMVVNLIKMTRPDIQIDDWGNPLNLNESYMNGNIMILGGTNYMQIELPQKELLSIEQFEKLKEILLEIKEYNESICKEKNGNPFEVYVFGIGLINISYNIDNGSIDELINILSNYTMDNLPIKDEVIIGEEIKSNYKK